MKKRLQMLLSAAMAGTLMLTGISLPTDVRAAQSAEFTSLGAISDMRYTLPMAATAPQIAETSSSAITLSFDVPEGMQADLEIDGMLYENVTSPFIHDSLNPDEEHTYRLRYTNTLGSGEFSEQVSAKTDLDPYRNVISGDHVRFYGAFSFVGDNGPLQGDGVIATIDLTALQDIEEIDMILNDVQVISSGGIIADASWKDDGGEEGPGTDPGEGEKPGEGEDTPKPGDDGDTGVNTQQGMMLALFAAAGASAVIAYRRRQRQ